MKIVPDAWRYAAPPLLLAGPLGFLSPVGTLLALATGGAILHFFRDPERNPPVEGILSPADGHVSVIREEGDRVRVGVFMNVTDVHVNRAPVGGRVESVEHEPGKHRPAFSKDSDNNEKVHIGFPSYDVTLIAGAFARRIHPYVESGDELERGERLGHIAFGSRADVLLPPSVDVTDIEVRKGQRVRAGETVLTRSEVRSD
ncbi:MULTISPECIES: protein sorting system archaetidylserine decarboxylase [unclassified Haladaptatus]|uniref:protein sorting system archaetidylserine decarboxylase n=1 Tax=unclassified Haladaptatus TaxID=2622732 RepID=UPI00209BFAA3|nr:MULTISPECIES: protein sorting system archaetidylserine decarboxylase [unclassified Haladaptatus]MCO8243869.1 protein sorting system archaetidylserine decarboxylase [Haladaptatus sp. AB643]MCO8253483.1 protein sorting system archaetidylserine decarboxylase [Haladaptatus sp. AB618]